MQLIINIGKKHLYTLAIILVVFLGIIFVNAYGGTNPSIMGHTLSEIAAGTFGDGNYTFPEDVNVVGDVNATSFNDKTLNGTGLTVIEVNGNAVDCVIPPTTILS